MVEVPVPVEREGVAGGPSVMASRPAMEKDAPQVSKGHGGRDASARRMKGLGDVANTDAAGEHPLVGVALGDASGAELLRAVGPRLRQAARSMNATSGRFNPSTRTPTGSAGDGSRPMTGAAGLCLIFVLVLSSPASAFAECAWVLWVDAPTGSDQWSVVRLPQSQCGAREECQRHADDLNALELTMAKGEFTGGAAHDAFTCFPCTVDPRPEGALLHEGLDPQVPKSGQR